MHPIDSNKVNNRFILCINLTKISNIYEAVISILLLSNLRCKLFNRKNLELQIYKMRGSQNSIILVSVYWPRCPPVSKTDMQILMFKKILLAHNRAFYFAVQPVERHRSFRNNSNECS
jgi:threonine/homoserine efflux transporter RhtA